jgi:hypothetical protein
VVHSPRHLSFSSSLNKLFLQINSIARQGDDHSILALESLNNRFRLVVVNFLTSIPSGSLLWLSCRVNAVIVCLPVLGRASVMKRPTVPPAYSYVSEHASIALFAPQTYTNDSNLLNMVRLVHGCWLLEI